MANRIVNPKSDPAIVTEKTTIINPSSIAYTASVNTNVDPNAKKSVIVPNSKPVTGIIPPIDIQPDVTFNSYVNTTVQNYLDTYQGTVTNAAHASVADVAISVNYNNIRGLPTFSTVAFSGSYNDLLYAPSLSQFATRSDVTAAINNVIDGAPGALNTLKELAASLANNSSYASSITTLLADKANISDIPSLAGYATTSYVDGKVVSWDSITGKPVIPTDINQLLDADGLLSQGTINYNDLTNKPIISDTTTLNSGDFFIAKDETKIQLGQWAAQSITIGSSGIQIAGTGGIEIAGIADAGITLGGETSGTITFSSATSGIDYNDLNNTPTSYDQSLNTTDEVEFYIANVGALNTTGSITIPNNGVVSGIVSDNGRNRIYFETNNSMQFITDDTYQFAFNSDGTVKFGGGYTFPNVQGTTGQALVVGDNPEFLAWQNQSVGTDTGNITFSDTTITSTNGNVKIHFSPSASPAVEFNFTENGVLEIPGTIAAGEIGLVTNNGDGVTGDKTFTFDGDGYMYLPSGSTIHEESSPAGVGNSLTLTPANGNDTNQKLMIYPTLNGEGNHLHLTSGNLEVTSLFLGNDSQYVRTVSDGSITIGTNDTVPDDAGGTGYRWKFGTDGKTTLPGAVITGSVTTTGSGDPAYPTVLDLTKSINKLSDNTGSYYTLADGVEGQTMYLVRQHNVIDMGYNSIHVLVATAYSGLNQLADQNLYFNSDIITLIFTDGAWQQSGGIWD